MSRTKYFLYHQQMSDAPRDAPEKELKDSAIRHPNSIEPVWTHTAQGGFLAPHRTHCSSLLIRVWPVGTRKTPEHTQCPSAVFPKHVSYYTNDIMTTTCCKAWPHKAQAKMYFSMQTFPPRKYLHLCWNMTRIQSFSKLYCHLNTKGIQKYRC